MRFSRKSGVLISDCSTAGAVNPAAVQLGISRRFRSLKLRRAIAGAISEPERLQIPICRTPGSAHRRAAVREIRIPQHFRRYRRRLMNWHESCHTKRKTTNAQAPKGESHGRDIGSGCRGNGGMGRFIARSVAAPWCRSRVFPARAIDDRGSRRRCNHRVARGYALRQYNSSGARGASDVGPRYRASHPFGHPLERGGDHPAGQQAIVRARRPRSTTSGSDISGARRQSSMAATSSISRAIRRRASMRVPSSRDGSQRSNSCAFGRKPAAAVFHLIRIPG